MHVSKRSKQTLISFPDCLTIRYLNFRDLFARYDLQYKITQASPSPSIKMYW